LLLLLLLLLSVVRRCHGCCHCRSSVVVVVIVVGHRHHWWSHLVVVVVVVAVVIVIAVAVGRWSVVVGQGVCTHWKGQTPTGQHVEMSPSSCVGVPSSRLLFAWHAEGSQLGETSQDTERGGTHSLEGTDTELLVGIDGALTLACRASGSSSSPSPLYGVSSTLSVPAASWKGHWSGHGHWSGMEDTQLGARTLLGPKFRSVVAFA
jgi:hypothetical protein